MREYVLLDLVWPSSPVSAAPLVVLLGWRIFELQRPYHTYRTRHFCGTKAHDGHGKASTPIVQFDPSAKSGVTESGRQHILVDSLGLDINAACTWNAFVRVNHAQDVVDVTSEIAKLMEKNYEL